MAVRYSGDTEVRLGWDPRRRTYRGSVRDPRRRWRGEVRNYHQDPQSPEAYDEAARDMIRAAERASGPFATDSDKVLKRAKIRRVFQAPCPVGMKE